MARVTSAEVLAILEETTADKDLAVFISMAALVVEEEVEPDSGLSEERLKEIERWLSAHFYCILSPRSTSESAGVSVSYEANSRPEGYMTTRYGMQACMLDTTGTLSSAGKRKATMKAYRMRTEPAPD